jgi:membrane associated rhomboid family serine protease
MIIPIGTKSSLALKPIITIGLIAVNIIIAIITLPLGGRLERKMFEAQKGRYSAQLRLYLMEHEGYDDPFNFGSRYIEESIDGLERAEDYADFQMELFGILGMIDLSFEELEMYGAELEGREDSFYEDLSYAESEAFYEWRRQRDREEKVLNGHVNFALGLKPTRMGRIHTFFTYQFLHGGIWHLLGNMLFLWVVGCLLEDSWGRIPFLIFYLLGGAFAGLAHCLQDLSSPIPLIGASGSIAAAMGAFAIRHFFTRIKFFYFFIIFFRPFWGTFHLPAYVFLPFWFVEQLVLKSLSDFVGASGVAYMAHIAGFAGGVTIALFFKFSGFEDKIIAPRVQNKQIDAGVLKDPRFEEACDLMDNGETESAKSLFSQLMRERPSDMDLLQDISTIYLEKGMKRECEMIAERVLKALLLKSNYSEAAEMVLRLVNAGDKPRLSPQPLIRIAKWLADNEQYGEAHDVYRFILSSDIPTNAYVKASVGLAILLALKMSNPADALEILKDAEFLDLDPDQSGRITDAFAKIFSLYPEMESSMVT